MISYWQKKKTIGKAMTNRLKNKWKIITRNGGGKMYKKGNLFLSNI